MTEGPRVRVLLAGIVTAAILIRIPGLLHDGLWRDEAYVYVDAIAPTFREFLRRVVETEYHPPLYFLISYIWVRVAGTTELALKALPFLCSVVTVPAVYRLGRIAGSTAIGLLAAAMYAASPLAILDSGDYLYPLMGLLCTALAGFVVAARREPLRPAPTVAIAVLTTLTMYTHYAALFFVTVLAAWALTSPRGVRHGAAVAGALLAGVLPFLFWLPTFLRQPNPYLLRSPGGALFGQPPNGVAKLGFFAWTIVRSMPLWPEKLAIVLCVLVAAAVLRVVTSRRINADATAMGLTYAIMLALVSSAGRLNVRYVVPFLGLFDVFLAWIAVAWFGRTALEHPESWRRWGAAVTAVLCIFVATEDVIFASHTAAMPKSGIRTFAMSQPLDPATLYVFAPDYITATFAFYARDAHVAYTAFPQTDRPEVYRYGSDAALLYAPDAVRNAVVRLSRMTRAYSYLDLIVDDAADRWSLSGAGPYPSPVRRLLDSVKGRYREVARTKYPGRSESVTVYRFCTSGRSGVILEL